MRIPYRPLVLPAAFAALLLADIRRLALDSLILKHPDRAAVELVPRLHRGVVGFKVALLAAEGVSPLARDNWAVELV